MNTEAPQLLSEERLAEIRAQLEVPRARNHYVTDYGVAADVVEELVDHIAATRLQVAKQLRGLLLPMDGYESSPVGYMEMNRARHRNQLILAVANALNLEL